MPYGCVAERKIKVRIGSLENDKIPIYCSAVLR